MRDNSHKRTQVGAALTAAALLAVTYPLAAPARAASGDIFNLGTLGGTNSYGYAINDAGEVVGDSDTADTAYHAFIYTGTPVSGGAMVDLATTGGASISHDINASGHIAGEVDSVGDGTFHAFLYMGTPGSGGAMTDLGTLGGTQSVGFAVNASNQVAGASTTTMGVHAPYHAFLYTDTPGVGGQLADLGTLGGTDSYGYGINNAGRVTGSSFITGDAAVHAFIYTSIPGGAGTMADLGTLGGTESEGNAINAAGQVAGSSSTAQNFSIHAFLYTGTPGSGGAMTDLGTLGGSAAYGHAINNAGQVVGSSDTELGATHAFLYSGTPGLDGHMIDLNAWLDSVNPIEGSKWMLTAARGITDTGLITGYGFYSDGQTYGTRAFLLDASALVVPEPCSLALLSIAALALRLSCSHRAAYKRSAER